MEKHSVGFTLLLISHLLVVPNQENVRVLIWRRRMEDGGWRIRLCIYTSKSFSFLPPFHSIEISKEDTRPGLIANERAFNILYDGIRNGKPFVLYVRKKAKATLR